MKSRVILALDVDSLKKARYFVNKLYPKIKIFKVGLQLFTACGTKAVNAIQRQGAEVFLDLKFLDIPNTVAHAVRQATRLKVKMLTVHITGGEEMIKRAVKAAAEEARLSRIKRPLLIGVTVLTSQRANPGRIVRLTRLGLSAGLDGVVCSAREVAFLKKKIKSKFVIVTPGIRPCGATGDDHCRTATAQEALLAGSNFLVVGRPILKAKDPLKVVTQMVADCKKIAVA